MHLRILVSAWGLLIAGFGLAARAAGPEDPAAATPRTRYAPVLLGMKSYRPVEPLPWGDVNRRVMPPGALEPTPGDGKSTPKPGTQHRH